MNVQKEKLKSKFRPYLPYGVLEPYDSLSPQMYYGIQMYWLKFFGLWYYDVNPKSLLFWLQLLYTLLVLWLVCFLPGLGEVFYLLKRQESIGNIAEGLYLFLSEMYTYFKVAVFWLNKKKILNLLKFLYCDEFRPEEKEHTEILKKSIKLARFITTYYITICVCAVSVAIILPITEDFEILPTNVEYPYFDVYKPPLYVIAYVHHIYYKPATCIIDGAMDTICAVFITFAIGQIDILAYNLRNFDVLAFKKWQRDLKHHKNTSYDCKHYVNYILKKCIVHYNAIIRYVSMIEDAFSLASALQLMLSVMVLCLVGIQILSIENPREHPMQMAWTAVYLSCMLQEVFILCWFGNELILKSTELRQAAFDGPWLKMDYRTMMLIVIFLERCQRPLQVSAGKIFILSLNTYTYLINWSYKAFALMTNMKK
ncbi:odorant receptor 46a-like [Danaus plexippus]|uniref:odorant receptor 46a-like n=1 Tax=Danaus plexippus TaxID=13037 RepID=UPI0013C4AFBB|nr:odorant receptor 46a-like [Danaus plexippus]